MSHPSLPCPTHLFKEILAISQLRVAIYSDGIQESDVRISISDIFKRIEAFVPNDWTESYFLPDIPEVPLLASIFQLAVGLYAFLVLPVEELLSSSYSYKDRIKRRNHLLELITKAFESENCRIALNWPLAVVGCAFANGSATDQALICKYLLDATVDPNSTQPLTIKAKLQRFWAAGMTHWDDCWREPFVVIG